MEHNIVSSLKVELQYGPCGLEIVLRDFCCCTLLGPEGPGNRVFKTCFSFWACLGAETDWTIQVSEPAAVAARPDLWDGTDRTLRTT